MNKVFLGGTYNSTWREELIPMLTIDYFNPVVENWTPECQEEERRQKKLCNIHLYVITSEMTGVFSIAEAVDSVHTGIKTIFHVNPNGFEHAQLKSLKAVSDLIVSRDGTSCNSEDLALLAEVLNKHD